MPPDKMTREEFDALPSSGLHRCPDCGSRSTHPYPGCGCPTESAAPTQPPFRFTRHINRFHHTCPERPRCAYCKRTPDQIPEYAEPAKEEGITPDQYVREEEGTYNPENGHFACTDCYIAIGMPSSGTGWTAP